MDAVKLLAAVVNPAAAKELFKDDAETVETVNENFEADLKKMDPNFNLANYKEVLDGLDK